MGAQVRRTKTKQVNHRTYSPLVVLKNKQTTNNNHMKPKKLIRKFITEKLKEGEWETITDQDELNRLYAIKIREELAEIQASDHKDIMEFVDLIQVAFSFARQNGFTHEQLSVALIEKSVEKGSFGRLALNNLNPDNPSNKLYFENVT